MALFQTDLVVKALIEIGLQDLRKNPWLFDDIFGHLKSNQFLADKYGQKYVDGARQWFLNQNVDVVQGMRKDGSDTPYVSINMVPCQEDDAEITLAQQTEKSVTLDPDVIGKPIPVVGGPYTVVSYDQPSGRVTLPGSAPTNHFEEGQFLVDTSAPLPRPTYPIVGVEGRDVLIAPGTAFAATTVSVLPEHSYWKARIERTSMRETVVVGCHVVTDANDLIYLFNIVAYTVLRYNEALLEGGCMDLMKVGFSEIATDWPFAEGTQQGLNRYVTISGLVRHEWIKAPRRVIESAILEDPDFDQETLDEVGAGNEDPETEEPVITESGIKIIGHDTPAELEPEYLTDAAWKGEFDN
jgi:hypothetical protein